LLHDADADVRILSCELLRAVPGEQATQLLCELLATESSENVCAAAVDVLTEAGDATAVPALAACAARFSGSPFLAFAIHTAITRIQLQPARPRG
jgi:HEAT repeat protein